MKITGICPIQMLINFITSTSYFERKDMKITQANLNFSALHKLSSKKKKRETGAKLSESLSPKCLSLSR